MNNQCKLKGDDRCNEQCHFYQRESGGCDVKDMTEEIARLREALEFYAKRENYKKLNMIVRGRTRHIVGSELIIISDGGERARQVLREKVME